MYNKTKIFSQAWDFVKRLGYNFSEALKTAWANAKFKSQATKKIVHFYFKKIDGSAREAFGTLKESLLPTTQGQQFRGRDCQVYFDTEKQEWRCYKVFNIIKVD